MARPRPRPRLKRRPPNIPPRAARYARSPAPPSGVVLFYRLQLTALLDDVQAAIRDATLLELDRFARTDASDRDDTLRKARTAAAEILRRKRLNKLADKAAQRVSKHSERETLRIGIRLREAAPGIGAAIDRFRERNVRLIESLVGRELDRIEDILSRGETLRVEELRKQIEHEFGVTRSKGDLLARDQVLKLNGDITRLRQQAAGIEAYVWTTSGDERVREGHAEIDGTTHRWDTPPVVHEESGRTAHPGEDYQCRCVAFPVLPELSEDEAA